MPEVTRIKVVVTVQEWEEGADTWYSASAPSISRNIVVTAPTPLDAVSQLFSHLEHYDYSLFPAFERAQAKKEAENA